MSLDTDYCRQPYYLPLYVQNEEGWRNLLWLMRASYRAIEQNCPPQVLLSECAEHNAGMIAFSGDFEGPVIRPLLDGQTKRAQTALRHLSELFAQRFYIQIMRHGYDHEAVTEPFLLDSASETGCPPIAVHGCYYESPDFSLNHNVLRCIDAGLSLNGMGDKAWKATHDFRSNQAMRRLFSDLPICYEQDAVMCPPFFMVP